MQMCPTAEAGMHASIRQVAAEPADDDVRRALQQRGSLIEGTTGASPDHLVVQNNLLREALQGVKAQLDLQARNNKLLQDMVETQSQEMKMLRAQLSEKAAEKPTSADADEAPQTKQEAEQGLGELSEPAARQRLRRLCKPNKKGQVLAPPHIVDEWKKCGTARDDLVRLFMDVGCDKDSNLSTSSITYQRSY